MSIAAMLSTPARAFVGELLAFSGFVGAGTATVTVAFIALASFLVARGLHRGHRLAWAALVVVTSVSAIVHAARGGDVVDVMVLAAIAAWLVARRRAFTVHPDRTTWARAALVAGGGSTLAVGASVAIDLTLPVHDMHATAGSAFLHLLGLGSGPLGFGGAWAAPALTAAGLGMVGLTLWTVMSPIKGSQAACREEDRERARQIVSAHGSGTLDYFALRDDKQWFFHANSVVAYAARGGVCLVSPDPIGPIEERGAVWAGFMQHVQSHGWTVSVLGADAAWLDTYSCFGLRPVYMGDEAVIDCSTFTLEGSAMKGLRQTCNRVRRHGYTVTFHDPIDLDQHEQAELLAIATASRQGAVERGFSMTLSRLFDPADEGLLLSVARDAEGRAQAFVQWVPAQGINGWSLDVMRRNIDESLPNGVMDFLVTQTISEVAGRGQSGLALNFAVLREYLESDPTTTVGRWAKRGLELSTGRSQISSLGRYNEKFNPSWYPRYAVLGDASSTVNQALLMATAEGLTELPVIGRFMTGLAS